MQANIGEIHDLLNFAILAEFFRVYFYLRDLICQNFPGSMLIWGPMLIVLGKFSRVYAYLRVYAY